MPEPYEVQQELFVQVEDNGDAGVNSLIELYHLQRGRQSASLGAQGEGDSQTVMIVELILNILTNIKEYILRKLTISSILSTVRPPLNDRPLRPFQSMNF